jgi:hypothetical protein
MDDHPEEYALKLRKPVTIGSGTDGITYDTLNLREPRSGELEKAWKETNHVSVQITLIALVASIPRRAAEQLSQRDFKEAGDYLGGFTKDGPTTGETP